MALSDTPSRHPADLQTYFELSAQSEERHEFEAGEMVAMGRTSLRHSALMLNAATALRQATQGRSCLVLAETVSVEVQADTHYFLPDVLLTCDAEDLQAEQLICHPSLIVEVLSPATEQRDRGVKFMAYLKMPDLQYYVLLSQEQVRVEVYGKMPDGPGWTFNYYEQWDDTIALPKLSMTLSVRDLYAGISWRDAGDT